MTQKEKEEKIAHYLYNKNVKTNLLASIQTEEVSSGVKMDSSEVGSFFGNSKYFEFSNGTPVGLRLTREGIDFVESKKNRNIDSLLKWGTFLFAIISTIVSAIGVLINKQN